MNPLDSLTSPLRDLWTRATTSGAPGPTTTTPPPTKPAVVDADATYDAAVERLPDPSIALPTLLARLDPVASKLDQVQATMKGPYVVGGQSFESGAQFRMAGGVNGVDPASDVGRLLATVAAKAGLTSALRSLQEGRGEPRALVALTQALIDAGQLGSNADRPVADRIHDLQWRFGIGIDCAGYVHRALAAVHGDVSKLGLKSPAFENFTGLPANPCFAKKAPADARAGDVVVLAGSGRPGDPGHNLIVRSRSSVEGSREELEARWAGAKAFLKDKTDVIMLEVDSSFGAHASGDPDGGVRRDVLLYDKASETWCTCRATEPPTASTGRVPYREAALTGIFRAKVSP